MKAADYFAARKKAKVAKRKERLEAIRNEPLVPREFERQRVSNAHAARSRAKNVMRVAAADRDALREELLGKAE